MLKWAQFYKRFFKPFTVLLIIPQFYHYIFWLLPSFDVDLSIPIGLFRELNDTKQTQRLSL